MKNNHQTGARSLAGFSLFELMVVIVLLGFLVAIAVPTIRSLGSLDLRNEITRIGALANEVYALAGFGKNHRIVFDLDENTYWVEEKVGDAGEIKPELGYKDLMKMKVESASKENGAERFLPSYKAVGGILGEKYKMPNDLVLYGAWTEEMDHIAREGQVAIYFFSGYTQSAFVSLAVKDEEESTSIYCAISPLTGEIEINQGEPNINDLRPSEKK